MKMENPQEIDANGAITGTTASASEVSRNFGFWLDTALSQPVTIERDGAPCAVLLSLDDFRRYRALEQRSFHPGELGNDALTDLKAVRDELASQSDWPGIAARKYDNKNR
jgi:PHD/YefM family antitoxin component YafN of YafNO toxin-antitoxin module